MKYFLCAVALVLTACSIYPTAEERATYIDQHDLKPHIERAIREQRAVVGMTYEQMVAALGKPHGWNTLSTRHGTETQYIYSVYNAAGGRLYVYVSGGKVTAVQY